MTRRRRNEEGTQEEAEGKQKEVEGRQKELEVKQEVSHATPYRSPWGQGLGRLRNNRTAPHSPLARNLQKNKQQHSQRSSNNNNRTAPLLEPFFDGTLTTTENPCKTKWYPLG